MKVHPGWKWFWRAVGIVAIIFMIVTTLLFWTAWRANTFKAVANGHEVKSGIDVIAIQLDILSLVMAIVAIGLGVLGIIGYQAVKSGAVKKAQKTAKAEVRILAPPLIRRELSEYMRTFRGETPISEVDLAAMVAAAGEEGDNGKK